ncbi:hypothetical protein V8J88_25210 [Massilia sp. W12]|uniref:hypothetical protein n=1 Tax=Massilia sp. W12 TaxID=3126507 RepID=UPI0030D033AC
MGIAKNKHLRHNKHSHVKAKRKFDLGTGSSKTITVPVTALGGGKYAFRRGTLKAGQALQVKLQLRSTAPSRHPNAKARAIDDLTAPHTGSANQLKIDQLKQLKSYKTGTVRVKFKGDRDSSGFTSGTSLGGARIDRAAWTPDQKKVRDHLSAHLMSDSSFVPATNKTSKWGSEIAHSRAQHAGGLSDPLGAQPASVHSNIEDMAREEGQKRLKELHGDNVRIKSTIYVHESGDLAGTVKAARHKIYFKNASGDWEKKFDHLQDGARGNINKSEAEALKKHVSGLSLSSPTIGSRKGIQQTAPLPSGIMQRPKGNDTTQSPHFTGMTVFASGKRKELSKQDSHTFMSTILSKRAAKL